jgi:FAD/FMN-containing dehydrogenase
MTTPLVAEPAGGDVVAVAASADLGHHIREAVAGGYGLVPRSSVGVARHGRAAAGADARLLDLSGLRDVPLLSARERVAIVEAGVTYAQLQPLLDAEGLRLSHPLLPPAGKSVVASQMDREPQMAPRHHWDFTDPLLCAELWFGTGDRFRTGSAAGPGATLEEQWRAGMFQKNPLGPAQTDIAKLAQGAQGALGFATWVSLRLELAAELRRDLRVGSDDLGAVAGFVSAITRRRLGEELLVFDRCQLARMTEALGVSSEAPVHEWTVLLTVGSLRRRPEESLKMQLHQVEELAAAAGLVLEDLTGTAAEELPRTLTSLPELPGEIADWKLAPTGTSRELSFLTTTDRAAPFVDHVRSRWGSLVGDDAVAAYLQPINQGRTCHVELTAFATPSEAERIDAGTAELVGELIDAGAFFSRPIGAAVAPTFARCGDMVRTLQKVKAVLDPDGVLSPGAGCFDPAVVSAAFEEVSSS